MTALLFFRKLRGAIIAERFNRRKILRGVTEVDESYTSGGKGGRKVAKQGRNLQGKIAFVGAYNRKSRQVRIEQAQSTKAAVLLSFIGRNIKRGAVVHTDSFRAYNDVKKSGYKHFKVNHFLTFKDAVSGACTNGIENVWGRMKRFLSRFCGGFRNNLHLWIAEIEFRIESGTHLTSALAAALRRAKKKGLPFRTSPRIKKI